MKPDKLPILLVNTKVLIASEFIEAVLRTVADAQIMRESNNHEALYVIEMCKERIGKNLVLSVYSQGTLECFQVI